MSMFSKVVEDLKSTDEYLSGYFDIVICPCCKIPTLNNYWICSNCGWEYDGVVDDEMYSSANRCKLIEYKCKRR